MEPKVRPRVMRILRLTGLGLVIFPIAWLAVSQWPPSVSATISNTQGDHFQVHVNSNFQVISLLDASLWATGAETPIWRHIFRFRPKTGDFAFHFGEPIDDERIPHLIQTDDEFCLVVNYQYDSVVPPSPCIASDLFWFRVAADGAPEQFGRRDQPHVFFKRP